MSALDLVPAEFREGYMNHAKDLTRLALKAQGTHAFESTKRCAAIHEAGHCVVNTITASDQHGGACWLPRSVRIWREPIKGLQVWLGENLPAKNAPPYRVDPRTDPEGYFTTAVRLLGGVVSEMMFDAHDYRMGSSIDEWVVASSCARTLTTMGMYPSAEQALNSLAGIVRNMLNANTHVVESIAARLERQRRIEGAELVALLRNVRATGKAQGLRQVHCAAAGALARVHRRRGVNSGEGQA